MLQMQLAQGPEDIPSEVSSFYNWSRLQGTSFLRTDLEENRFDILEMRAITIT